MAQSAGDIESIAFVSLGCPKNLVDSERMLGLLAGGRADGHLRRLRRPMRSSSIPAASSRPPKPNRCRRFAKRSQQKTDGPMPARGRGRLPRAAPQDQAAGGRAGGGPTRRRVRSRAHRRSRPRQGQPAAGTRALPRQVPRSVAASWRRQQGLGIARLTRVRSAIRETKTNRLPVFEDDRARLRLTPRHYAYLRISEGCNQGCSFCTIPSIRGLMRSKPIEQILPRRRELAADGAVELNLIGQDTTSYGTDIGYAAGLVGTASHARHAS